MRITATIALCLLAFSGVAQSTTEMRAIATVADMAARNPVRGETILVVNGDSYSIPPGNAVFFRHYPSSTGATNTTDTVTALGGGRWIVVPIGDDPGWKLNTDDLLTSWVESTAFSLTNALASSSGLITNAFIRWPDGSGGTYTATEINPEFGSVDAFEFVHSLSGKTLVQSSVSRDENGAVTNKPLITITPPGDTFTYPANNYIGGAGYYATLAGLAAATNNFTLVFIGADTNGIPGLWVRGIGSGTVDGANYAADAAGVQVKRIQ